MKSTAFRRCERRWPGTENVRPGFTLFEVVIALAILLVSMAAIAPLVSTGSRAAINAELASQAALRCESKLAEILSGIEPFTPTADVPFDDAPDWTWALELSPTGVENLWALRVTVRSVDPQNGDQAVASLVRWARDPQVFAAADESTFAAFSSNAISRNR